MRLILAPAVLLFVMFSCCRSGLQKEKVLNDYEISATSTFYVSAMGKSRGIIFRIRVADKLDKTDFTIDSLWVNGKTLNFIRLKSDSVPGIEADYFRATPEPSLSRDGKTMENDNYTNDPILDSFLFYPSYVVIKRNNKFIKIPIEKYTEISESH